MSFWIPISLFASKLLLKRKNAKRLRKIETQVQHDLNWIAQKELDNTEKKGTLVIKCDDIGDFLVWQQVIPLISQNAEKPVYFVGNKVLKNLYEEYFDFADQVLWIDKSKWDDFGYRSEVYERVSGFHADTVLNTGFTRNYVLDDLIMVAAKASHTYAWSRKHHYIFPDFNLLDSFVEHSLESEVPLRLEYFRNIEYVNQVYHLNREFDFEALYPNFTKHQNLVVVPVASAPSKTWSSAKFIETIHQVKHKFNKIYLIGGQNAMDAALEIEKTVDDSKLVNLVNQTKLHEMFAFVGESRLLLTVDTFAAHLGPLCATDTIVIANGTNWQRFGDYEPYVKSKFKLILPPHVKRDPRKLKLYYNGSEINQIKVSDVVNAILETLA